MGNITYQKAFRKQQRKSYKGLTEEQKKYIKAKEFYELADKELNRFYSTAKRKDNGNVDFENMEEHDLDLFEHLNKSKDKAFRVMSKLEDIIDIDYTLNMFLQINTHSMSF
jgi:hypothetical protein